MAYLVSNAIRRIIICDTCSVFEQKCTPLAYVNFVMEQVERCEYCSRPLSLDYPKEVCGTCQHRIGLHTKQGCCGNSINPRPSNCGCVERVMDEPDTQLLMRAARKIAEARLGPEYKVTACATPTDTNSAYWNFDVEKKDIATRRSKNPQTLLITQEDLLEVAIEELSVEQIRNKQLKSKQLSEEIRREYLSGTDSLFEPRE